MPPDEVPPETPGQSPEPGGDDAGRIAYLESELGKTIKQKQRKATELEEAKQRLSEIEPKLAELEGLQTQLDEVRSSEATARGELVELQRSVRADAFRRELQTKLPEGVNEYLLDAVLAKAEAEGLDTAPEDASAGAAAAIEHLRDHAPQLLDPGTFAGDPFPAIPKVGNAPSDAPPIPNARRI